MPARYRVALQGFSDFERSTLAFCLRHAATREPGYVHVESIDESDFIVADASHAPLADSVTRHARLPDTLFIGDHAPRDARAQLRRPIDPERILRALDGLAARRRPAAARDIVLPPGVSGARIPTLDISDIVDTTPAAFQHEPLSVSFTDLESFHAAGAAQEEAEPSAPAPSPAPLPEAKPAPRAARAPAAATQAAPPRPIATERATAKAAARRASRLARMAQSGAAAADLPRDVLLLDGSANAAALEALLVGFGFRVYRADTLVAAMSVLGRSAIAAAFIDVDAQDASGIDGLDLCKRIKRRGLPLTDSVPAVMLLADRDSASGRVRAKLAGADAFLVRPVERGDAARALEACNISLPADARRG